MTWTPVLPDIVGLRNTLDRAVSDAFWNSPFQTLWSRAGGAYAQVMPIDAYSTDEQVVILAAVPGMKPEDLELTIHQNTVTLSGKIASFAESEEAKNATWYVHELVSGTFRRSLTLPFPVDADQAQATFADGVLRVVLPKAESAKPRKIAIGVGQGQPQAIEAGQSGTSKK